MAKIKVLVAHPFGRKADIERIRAVDPRVEAVYAPLDDCWFKKNIPGFGDSPPFDREIAQDFGKHVSDAEVIFSLHLPDNLRAIAPNLKWVQFYGVGIHHIANSGVLESGIPVALARVITPKAIPEFCLALMLMHAKRLVAFLDAQRDRRWSKLETTELHGKTLGIIGPGRIGSQVAKRASAFEMQVLAVRGRYSPGETLPHIDRVYPPDSLIEMLRQCDYVVLSVVLRPGTRKLVGEPEIRAMKRGAFFINISRGALVDEPALVRALADGHLGGAGLDVFEQEPLSLQSPLWDMPNVVILPHSTGHSREAPARATDVFCRNLQHYIQGRPLDNLAPPEKGYFGGYEGGPRDAN